MVMKQTLSLAPSFEGKTFFLAPSLANRHGRIADATDTGKTSP